MNKHTTRQLISRNQRILLDLLKTSLFGIPVKYPSKVDWNEVIIEAKAQTVNGLLSSVIPEYDKTSEMFMAKYIQIMYEQDRLLKVLDSCGIPCVILKGCAAAIYYPRPYLRAMGDIDILVPRFLFDKTVNTMEANGYERTKEANIKNAKHDLVRELSFVKNGVEIEIHHHFSSPGFDIDDILENAIERRQYKELNGFVFPMLPELENGLVLIGHINQHLKNNALGLRQVLDWEMYLHYINNSDCAVEDLVVKMKESGLFTLATYVTQMCIDHIGLPKSYEMCGDIRDGLSNELLSVVLANGNFGMRDIMLNHRAENSVQTAVYRIRRNGFFNYYVSVGMRTQGFLKTRPYLKPLAFLCGFFRQCYLGGKAVIRNRQIMQRISEGKRRDLLYQRIGVKTKD